MLRGGTSGGGWAVGPSRRSGGMRARLPMFVKREVTHLITEK
jgi:hypothetical protein